MRIIGANAAIAVYETIGDWPLSETGAVVDVLDASDLTDEQRAAIYELADANGWTVDPPRNATARLWALLSPAQRAVPIDEVVWSTLRGVVEIAEWSQGLRRRKILAATTDVGTSPVGEAVLKPGSVAAVIVEYRYKIVLDGIAVVASRVRYPAADGSGDVLTTEWEESPVQGADRISMGRSRRARATDRAGYFLGVGVVAAEQDPTYDPGPRVTHLLGVLASNAGYDLVSTFERSGDTTVLSALSGYTGDHYAWLDLDLGLGFTARGLSIYELTEPTVDEDGWTV